MFNCGQTEGHCQQVQVWWRCFTCGGASHLTASLSVDVQRFQSAVVWTKLLESLPPPTRWKSCPPSVMSSEKQAAPWRENAAQPQKTHEKYHEAFSKPTMK